VDPGRWPKNRLRPTSARPRLARPRAQQATATTITNPTPNHAAEAATASGIR